MKRYSITLITLFLLFSLHAEVVIPRLSPLPVNIEEQRVGLAGNWLFSPAPDTDFWKQTSVSGWKPIEVPGEWVMQGFKVEPGKAAGYYRTFAVPTAWKGQRVKLRCNAIFSESHVYINGQAAGSHVGGFTPFELDVTELVTVGTENRIAISVISETLADSVASASKYAVHPMGGISRDLYLFSLPTVNLSSFHASTAFDTTYTNATLTTEIELTNEVIPAVPNAALSLQFTLTDASGNEVALPGNRKLIESPALNTPSKHRFDFPVTAPKKWDSEHPNLYTLTCHLMDGTRALHVTQRRIGFRQIEVRGNQMYVNDQPIKLRGVCRHEVMPLRGRSVNDDMWRKDVESFRRGNVNYIRTSHYPPDEALMEACDELGMFVEVEAPFCWAHQTKVPADRHYEILINQHVEMVNLNRSHPSVLMWSMANESLLYTEYFKGAADVVKKLDPTRPRIFSQWGPDSDNEELEVANHHYPGPKGPAMYQNSKRPTTFDEFCHLNAYNRFELAADPGLRSMWGVLLDRMWEDMYNSKGVLGGAIWAGIDDTFFLPGGMAVGYGTWGPLDGWRREKPEYWGMKKAFSPVKVKQKGNMNTEGVIAFEVENRHNFANLSECTFTWEVAESDRAEKGSVSVSVPARQKGDFEIVLPQPLHNASSLRLIITGVRGFTIDEYLFQLLPEQKAIIDRQANSGKLTVKETTEELTIQTTTGSFRVDKRSGLMQSGSGETLLQSPALMVLPLNGEGDGIQMVGKAQDFVPYTPVCSNWTARSVSYTANKVQAVIRVEGSYQEADGFFIYTIGANGLLTVAYDFEMRCAVSPRQIGLVFTLPASYSHLAWERRGDWSVYPENHIGALKGEAEAFNSSLPMSGLAGPSSPPTMDWSFDQTKAGSNLFRSTKENILSATLRNTTGGQVDVISDGKQHIRAWKDGEQIRFLVADYTNAGAEGFLVSHAEVAYRPLRLGDHVKGVCQLLLLTDNEK